MNKGDTIHGYTLTEDFRVAGGTSQVSFVEKGGKNYFIKLFLYPKYPTAGSPGSERVKAQKRKACEAFEKHHRELNSAIGKCCAGEGGHLVYALDFFREGPSYYKVTEKIDIVPYPCSKIASLPLERILLIAKSAVHSIRILHGLKIVHGDLKPDNLPIKEAKAGYVVKLIDFDDSYFEGRPPKDHEELVGTPEYYSPEQAAYIMDEDEEIPGDTLTCKSDIFTLGIIFSEYFSGEKPVFKDSKRSTWLNIQNGESFSFDKPIHSEIDKLIRRMLELNPASRPTISEVFNTLKNIKTDKESVSPTPPPHSSGLRFGPGIKTPGILDDPKSGLGVDKPVSPTSGAPMSGGLRGKGLNIANKKS